jgi:hypothetical protein
MLNFVFINYIYDKYKKLHKQFNKSYKIIATLLLDQATFELSRLTPKGYKYPTLRTAGLENVGASTSHNPMGHHGLLQG